MRRVVLAVLLDRFDGAAGEDGNAFLLHLAAEVSTHVVIEAAQDVVAAIDHRHVRAVAGEDAGEFERDVAAALDQDALRQFRQMKRLVRGDHMLDAGNGGAVIGRAAGGDQDGAGLHGFAVGEAQRVGVGEHGAGLHDFRAGFLHVGGIGRLQPRDFLVLVGNQRPPVEARARHGPAEAGGILHLLAEMRAEHEQLLRHAAADHAGAAHPVLFRDHHAGAVVGRDPGGAHAARSPSDDKQVDVELSHFLSRPSGQICLPRLRISARNWALTVSAKFCAQLFI